MELTGSTAATLAIGEGESILLSQAYGYEDRWRRTETRTSATFRIASCTKPVTRVVIESLIEEGVIQRETPVFQLLGLSARGRGDSGDRRLDDITIDHLCRHTGGWDREATFDPLFEVERIGRELRVVSPEKRHLVQYMMTQPLQCDPGSEVHYSNFGYLLLGMVIERVTGDSYIEQVRKRVTRPLQLDDVGLSSDKRRARHPREVYYPVESELDPHIRDSSSGLVMSAETLCHILNHYWLDGQPRVSARNRYFFHFGTHPGTTTAVMEQRLDGLNYVLLMNGRREETYNEDNTTIREQLNAALDTLASDVRKSQFDR